MAETTSIKLKPGLKERLQRLAEEANRSPHWLMNHAIENYVEREEKRRQFDRDALEALEHYKRTGLHATFEEVDAWLEKLARGENAPPPKVHT